MKDQVEGRRQRGIKGDKGRTGRLAAELRENLRRRKAQSRAMNDGSRDAPGKITGGAVKKSDSID